MKVNSQLQKKFEIETIQKASGDVKIAAIAASIAFPLFSILDYFVYPKLYFQFLFIRIMVVFFSIVIFFLIKTKIGNKFPRELGMLE